MDHRSISVKPLDPHHVSVSEKMALNVFDNRMLKEQWPEDSPKSADETLGNWRYVPKYLDLHQWAAWTDGDREMVARAYINIGRYDENEHMADFDIYVLPEMRRIEIGKRLLRLVTEVARREDRRLLIVSTDSIIPSGAAFMRRLKAREGVASATHQLDLANLNLRLVDEWCQRGHERTDQFALGTWSGRYPNENVEEMATMKEVMNTSPIDNLEFEDFRWTVEQVRQEERELENRGISRLTMFVRHIASHEIAGYTEVLWNYHHPELLTQGSTAVVPKYRNRGLAQWIKGELLREIIEKLPEVKRIRSEVADSNASMLRINRRLGFRRYKSWTTWQLDLDRALEYLGES